MKNITTKLIKQTLSKNLVRSYGVKAAPKAKTADAPRDTRNDIIKNSLFEAPLRPVKELSEEEIQRHEIIEQTWKLYCNQKRVAHQESLNVKYQRMRDAATLLEQLNPELYANSQLANHSLLFPKQMKIPTETPANVIWNKTATKVIPAPTLKAKFQIEQ